MAGPCTCIPYTCLRRCWGACIVVLWWQRSCRRRNDGRTSPLELWFSWFFLGLQDFKVAQLFLWLGKHVPISIQMAGFKSFSDFTQPWQAPLVTNLGWLDPLSKTPSCSCNAKCFTAMVKTVFNPMSLTICECFGFALLFVVLLTAVFFWPCFSKNALMMNTAQDFSVQGHGSSWC